ncbi:unnamed protein product [Brassica napus]|uniref:(rape) hypothetical protein n=1 Tax=Brassica napus TaxID=3708 RepID=A0A816T2C1_BRANA|nr:unnamed protein product [Brassica napus]
MELMRRIFGRQGSKPEAMYSTHVQDAEQNEQLDKSVPETQDNDGDHTNDVHHHSQTISLDSPPRCTRATIFFALASPLSIVLVIFTRK